MKNQAGPSLTLRLAHAGVHRPYVPHNPSLSHAVEGLTRLFSSSSPCFLLLIVRCPHWNSNHVKNQVIDMALLDYYQILIIPFILTFSIPLALFATITSFLAFTILLIRVLIIYAELAVAVIPYYILGLTSPKGPDASLLLSNTGHSSPNTPSPPSRRRKRRTSSASNSTTSLTPVPSALNLPLPQSIGPQRDFEGVGGWRLDAPSDDDSLWTNMNSRLELPADHVRRHKRSLTSGSMPLPSGTITMASERRRGGERSYSPEMEKVAMVGMSPNTSRARTPPSSIGGGAEGYFPSPASLKGLKKNSPPGGANGSGSSGSSKGNGGLSMRGRS